MKSILIIGAGKFGSLLCRNLANLGNEIMIVDDNEEKLSELLGCVEAAKIGDCTKPDVLRSFGPNNFDVCIVCVSNNFQSSLEITNQLRELGAKRVISLASTDIQAKFLLCNGADKVIYPEHDIAERVAMTISHKSVFDYIQLSDEYSIFEMMPPDTWVGRSIKSVNVRAKYQLTILAIKKDGKLTMPSADYLFKPDEHLMIMGRTDTIHELVEKT